MEFHCLVSLLANNTTKSVIFFSYDFAKGKTPTIGVTLVVKYCCLPLIMIYNKACILVEKEGGQRQQRRRITQGCIYYHPKSVGKAAKCSYNSNSLSHVNSSLKLFDTSCSEIMGTKLLRCFFFF